MSASGGKDYQLAGTLVPELHRLKTTKAEGRGKYKEAIVNHLPEIECFVGQMGSQVLTDILHVVLLHISFVCSSLSYIIFIEPWPE